MKAADSISIVEMFSEIAVALHEGRDALTGPSEIEQAHGARMSAMFAAIETALATLEPQEWSPGRYFDLAAETLLEMDGIEPKLYAAAFRRAGSALLRRPDVGAEEFGLAFTAMASGFRDHAGAGPEGEVIDAVWEQAAAAYLEAEHNGFSLPGSLRAAYTAAQEHALGTQRLQALANSSALVIRAMRDALE